MLSGFEKPENKAKFKDIKDRAGNNLVKLLEETFPAAMEIQQEVIRSHGFSPDQEGNNVSYLFEHNPPSPR